MTTVAIEQDVMEKAADILRKKAERIRGKNSGELIQQIKSVISEKYKIAYSDSDTICIKIDRRKNINVINDDIKSTVERIVGDESFFIIKHRSLNGIVVLERRR